MTAAVPRDLVICPTCRVADFDELAPLPRRALRCRRCTLGLEACLSAEPFSAYARPAYDKVRQDGTSAWSRFHHDVAVAEARLHQLADHLPKPEGVWLDVGSNTGAFLVQARRHGWDVAGVELDPGFCTEATAVSGVTTYPYSVWAATAAAAARAPRENQGRPRVVSLFDVLEHVYDPTHLVTLVTGSVGAGGRVVVEVPDLDQCESSEEFRNWKHRKVFDGFTEHVWHFNERSLARMFEVYGWPGSHRVQRPLPGRLQFVWVKA